jgi:hypothetical protein
MIAQTHKPRLQPLASLIQDYNRFRE